MSKKNLARIAAKEAIDDARVDKVKGNLVITRIDKNGRLSDWKTKVRNIINEILPEWEIIESKGSSIVFALVKPNLAEKGTP